MVRRIHSKKQLVLGSALLIIVLTVGVICYLAIRHNETATSRQPSKQAQSEAKKSGLVGDQSLAARYIDAVKKNPSTAQKVFDTAISAAPTTQAKLDLISQNVSLALLYKRTDDALAAALKGVTIAPSFKTYNDAIRVYTVKRDFAKQQEMLEKAIASENASNDPLKDQVVSALEVQLNGVKQAIAAGVGK